MDIIKKNFRSLSIVFVVSVQIFFGTGFIISATALAEEAATPEATADSSTSQTTTQQAPTTPAPAAPTTGIDESKTGPTAPTGADSKTYTYNKDSGAWENDKYSWNPDTKVTTPKTQPEYTYNPDTKTWSTTKWEYDAPSGKYIPHTVTTPPPTNSQSKSLASQSSTGPNSNNNIDISKNSDLFFSGFNDTSINNNITSNSISGNSSVLQNTLGGSAITGDSSGMANIINLLQSSWGPNYGDISTFSADINGDITGDLYLDLSKLGPNSNNTANNQSNLDLTVNNSEIANINNNIAVDATSGNALVSDNTKAGDAKSGDAIALANVLNFVNSQINSGQSFVGVINIKGNLNGDILAPYLTGGHSIASSGPGSNVSSTTNTDTNINGNYSDNTTINNNINLASQSGTANVSNNTIGGSATTGDATTNVLLLNLTGKKIEAKDALLVFVNVYGQWVGLIMDATQGSNTATIGTDANVSSFDQKNTNVSITANSDKTINNDINLSAQSGDASVSNNTEGGSAQSGNAYSGANVANVVDSELSLSGWFGVLFINVFGTWNGSFGINTSAGDIIKSTSNSASNKSAGDQDQDGGVFNFMPLAEKPATDKTPAYVFALFNGTSSSPNASSNSNSETAVLSANNGSIPKNIAPQQPAQSHNNFSSFSPGSSLLVSFAALAFGIILISGDKILALIRSRIS